MRQSSVPPYRLTVEVCGCPISMELDTGVSVSVTAGKAFKRTFPGVPAEASGVMLRSYSGQLAQVEGQAHVSVRLGDRKATLSLYLTKGPSPTLLGQNWIQALGVWLPEYQEVVRAVEDVPSLLTKFKALFQPGSSEWAAPIVPVLKQDGSVRICGDFKVTIDPVATVEKYPLPRIEDLWWALSGGQKFIKLDLRDAYKQLVLQESSQNAEYLGDVISKAGLALAPRKVEAVLKAPKPQNKKELQSYLGLINFYRTFLPNLSSHLQPLHLLLRDGQQWAWREEQNLAFQCSKELITKAPVLVHFDPAKPAVLMVDASPYGVGAVLTHRQKNGQECPISFASRRLHAAEQ
nr:uncharacterized protein LOC119159711 [Rhipicephalus microplus]